MKCFIVFACIVVVGSLVVGEDERKPVYKYRYETEDFMKTAASSVPLHGYHVVEGGYYPSQLAGGYGGFSRYTSAPSGFGGSGFGYGGYPSGFDYRGDVGFPGATGAAYAAPYYPSYYHQPQVVGGEYIDKSAYGAGKKNLNDHHYEKAGGATQVEGSQGKEGFVKGAVAQINNKGDSGYYNGEQGVKKVYEDGKNYHGGHQHQQSGKNADEKKSKSGHKKGHVVKGFKTTHHKDESGRTEEYFDEANDEGGNYNYHGKSGAFAENSGAAFKGGHANDHYNAEKSKKEGHFNNEHAADNANADKGQYGHRKYYGNGQNYGVSNGIDQQSLLGHAENTRFYKNHPYHVPFYH